MTAKLLAALGAAICILACAAGAAFATPTLRVSANQLVDGSGAPLRVAGVNRPGTEYACAQGWGIFDGPTGEAAIKAIVAWHANAVRVPLNEDCWLGVNGVDPAYAGASYQSAVRAFVSRLQAQGLIAILDLHWGAPGTQLALGQEEAPDASHAPAFWSSVAAQYKGVQGVAFDLFNEPHNITWSCWLNGCTTSSGWRAAGMQTLVDAVRGAGATQPVIAQGLGWGGNLTGWLANRPSDPAGQLVAGWHVYNWSGCSYVACWNNTIAPVAQQVPVLATEVGENDCTGSFLDTLLPWADAHAIGYLAWSWHPGNCGAGPSLITNYEGAPTPYGAAYREYIGATHAQGGEPSIRFDFEDGTTEGWAPVWGRATVSLANERDLAFTGTHALALSLTGPGWPAIGESTELSGLAAGATITYEVWAPTGVSAGASPVVYDGSGNVTVLAPHTLAPGWNEVQFAIPAGVSSVSVLGLQIDDGTGWTGRLLLDSVRWGLSLEGSGGSVISPP